MFSTVTKQLKRAIGTVKSVLAVAGTAAAVLDPRLRSYLREGEQLDGIVMVQLTMVRWIEDEHRQLEELETAHRDALRHLKRLRMRRDAEQNELYGRMLRIRTTFEDAFGQGTAAVFLGLEPRLNTAEPIELRRHGQETANILLNPEFTTPKPVVAGIWEKPVEYAEQIRSALKPFATTLDEIETQKRDVEVKLKAKTDMLAQLNRDLNWSVRFFEAVYKLAGQDFHAERLRVNFISRPASEEGAGEPDSDAGEPSSDAGEPATQTEEAPAQPSD